MRMILRAMLLFLGAMLYWLPSLAQQSAPAPRPWNQNPNGMHVYLQAGLKSHQVGQHDYPQFLADWSKILTEHGAIVDGSLHAPDADELENTDVLVIYKGDAGYMTDGATEALSKPSSNVAAVSSACTIRCVVLIRITLPPSWGARKSMAK